MIESPPMPGICYAYVGWFKIWFPLNKRKKMWSFTTHLMFRSHCPRISKVFPWFFHIFFDFYLILPGFPRIFPWLSPWQNQERSCDTGADCTDHVGGCEFTEPCQASGGWDLPGPYAPWCWIFVEHMIVNITWMLNMGRVNTLHGIW